jgi:type I restriction enzyme S subunit
MALRPKPGILDQVYLFHFLRFQENYINGLASGATVPGIRKEDLAALRLRLPPLEEQRRIAVILDAADNLRAKRRTALAKLHKLAQSIFIDMFGDPALNTRNWPVRKLAELSLKFSDGPFGSNLKSQHYVQSGVRVVRLQNIGVGKFIDDDKAYISEPHFRSLQKHECLPGDVIVGTLGDPNLRACVLPSSVYPALNKADCVQIRPNESLTNAAYICHLLNNPSTERMAQGLILGQTRLRISMGRLKQLEVPVPPLSLQSKFHEAVSHVEEISGVCEKSAMALDNAFSSLQYRAFKGEL